MLKDEIIDTDILIIGAGIAGIRTAIEAHDLEVKVVLTTKGAFGKDGAVTWMAGYGYQAALYPPDSVETYFQDSIRGGKYLNNQKLLHTLLGLAPNSVEELQKWGMRLAKEGDRFHQIMLPGHSYNRSIHSRPGLFLGPEYRRVLPHQIRRREGIQVLSDVFFSDLLSKNGKVIGARGVRIPEGEIKIFRAKAMVLATGGYMACYRLTSANPTITGDGHAMAFRAGTKLMDMEFNQFMPVATLWPPNLYGDITPFALLIELYGIFYNSRGERFMERYYPKEKDWVTREAAGRAIMREAREGRGSPHGGAYLSFKHLPRNFLDRFLEKAGKAPFFEKLREAGVDLHQDAIEVGPTAHYVQGGLWIDEDCRSTVDGLYAVGEVASGGMDGADRLAGNALPFCMVMGKLGGRAAAERAKSTGLSDPDEAQVERLKKEILSPLERKEGVRGQTVKEKIRGIMSSHAIFARNKEGLEEGLKELENIEEKDLSQLFTPAKQKRFNLDWIESLEARNMLVVAQMVLKAALQRTESRGLHERSDYPDQDPQWLKHILIQKVEERTVLSTEPVSFPYLKP